MSYLAAIYELIEQDAPAFAAADPALRSTATQPAPSAAVHGHAVNGYASNDHAATPTAVVDFKNRPEAGHRERVKAAAERSPSFNKRLNRDYSDMGGDRSGSAIKHSLVRLGNWAGLSREDIDDLCRYHPDTADSYEKEGERGQDNIWGNIDADAERTARDFSHVKPLSSGTKFITEPDPLLGLNRGQKRVLRRLSRHELANMPPYSWLYVGFIPAAGIIFFAGAPKSFKTFIVLLLAICAAAGAPFAGVPPTSGPHCVAIWAGEGIGNLHARISAIETHYVLDAGDRLSILTGPFSAADVIELFKDDPPAVLIIDTLARAIAAHGWEENSNHDMGLFIAELDEIREVLGCLIIVVHHLGKDAGKGMRGATALLGAADAVFTMTKTPTDVSEFVNSEMKEAETAPTLFFELEKHGDSAVAVLALRTASIGPEGAVNGPVGRIEIAAFIALRGAVIARQRLQPGLEAGAQQEASIRLQDITANAFFTGLAEVAVSVDEWRELFLAKQPTMPRKTAVQGFRRAKKALQDKRLVIITGNFAQLSPAASMNAQGVYSGSASPNEGVNQ